MNAELKWIVQTGAAFVGLWSLLQVGRKNGWL
jgi:hypothetical protein